MKLKLKELEEKICKSTNIDGDFNTTLPVTDRISRQKIRKDIELNNTTKELSLTFTNIPPNRIIHSFHVCMEMHHKRADTGS